MTRRFFFQLLSQIPKMTVRGSFKGRRPTKAKNRRNKYFGRWKLEKWAVTDVEQGLTIFFNKGPNSKYFRLCRPHNSLLHLVRLQLFSFNSPLKIWKLFLTGRPDWPVGHNLPTSDLKETRKLKPKPLQHRILERKKKKKA